MLQRLKLQINGDKSLEEVDINKSAFQDYLFIYKWSYSANYNQSIFLFRFPTIKLLWINTTSPNFFHKL